MKSLFIINGSASSHSSNERLIENLSVLLEGDFSITVFNGLKALPHFDTELSVENTPEIILNFRKHIEAADAVIICTPEYVFSIPSGLKNAIEWCISTTVFSDKALGIITASASGVKGHEELQLIMKTAMAKFIPETTLLIQGIKGKINLEGEIIDTKTQDDLDKFSVAFKKFVGKDKKE